MSDWIDRKMTNAGIKSQGVGAKIVQLSGSRTRDIVQVARRCYDLVVQIGRASVDDAERAFEDIIVEEHDFFYESWLSLTAYQQNVLRAVAGGERGLTTREILNKFTLGSSGTVTNTVNTLIKSGYLIRQDPYTQKKVTTPTGYDFDSPFFKGWVIRYTLSDIGVP